jgi:hypothetical protein
MQDAGRAYMCTCTSAHLRQRLWPRTPQSPEASMQQAADRQLQVMQGTLKTEERRRRKEKKNDAPTYPPLSPKTFWFYFNNKKCPWCF